jgi:hypothetical protein
MDPINYTAQMPQVDFARSIASGLQVGQIYQQNQILKEQRGLAIQQQQMAVAQQQAYKADISGYMTNPSAQGAAALIAKYPQQAAALKSSWDMTDTKQKEDELGVSTQAYAAANAGRDDIVQDLLQKRIDAKKNSGLDFSPEQQLLDIQSKDPSQIKAALGLKLATVMGPEKFAATYGILNDQSRQDAEAPAKRALTAAQASKAGTEANIANATYPQQVQAETLKNQKLQADMQNQADRLNLDRDKLTTDTQLAIQESRSKYGTLPPAVMDKVDAATSASIVSQQSAVQMNNLADQFIQAAGGMNSGAAGRIDEVLKKTAGMQNEVSRIRSEYNRIVTPAAMAAYKKVAAGSTSDKDIDTAMIGVPKDTDPPERLASFLRGAAKLQVYDSVSKNAESEWLGANKFLGKASTDLNIDGVQVPAGTTFKQFADQFVERKAAEQFDAMAVKKAEGRKYGRYSGGATGGF